jgi:hypothetical protein
MKKEVAASGAGRTAKRSQGERITHLSDPAGP